MTLPDYRDPRLTEQRNPRTERIDVASTLEIVDLLNAEDATVAGAVRGVRGELARAIDLVVDAFGRGGGLISVGAGTPGQPGVLGPSVEPATFRPPAGIGGAGPHKGRSRHEARPQHALHRRDDPARPRVWQPHGGPDGAVRQAAGPRGADRDGMLQRGPRGGARCDRSGRRECEAGDRDGASRGAEGGGGTSPGGCRPGASLS